MKLPTSADRVYYRYHELRATLESPSGSGAVVETGTAPQTHCGLARCRRCRKRKCASESWRWGSDGRRYCVCCQRLWPMEKDAARITAGLNPSPRRDSVDARLFELGILAAIMDKPKRWEREAWKLYLELGSYAATADEAKRRWPRAGHIWDVSGVRRLVKQARQRIERHLEWRARQEARARVRRAGRRA